MEKLKIGTIIEITNDTGDVHWHKGEIGRIVDKMPGASVQHPKIVTNMDKRR